VTQLAYHNEIPHEQFHPSRFGTGAYRCVDQQSTELSIMEYQPACFTESNTDNTPQGRSINTGFANYVITILLFLARDDLHLELKC